MIAQVKRRIKRNLEIAFPGPLNYVRRMRGEIRAKRLDNEYWAPRIKEVLSCPDNAKLPRHPDAGKIRNGLQIMQNGLLVEAAGYYGSGMAELLRKNRGCHEPQEELVFAAVLAGLSPGATMIECGAYWGFYSMWLARDIPKSSVWLVEPDENNIEVGRRNFATNGLSGSLTQAFVGGRTELGSPPQICVDDFMDEKKIGVLNILHADIQGAEVEMLKGASRCLAEQRVEYVFISTHGESLHDECVDILRRFNYKISASVNLADTYSSDGLVVAQSSSVSERVLPSPCLKTEVESH